MTQVMRIKGEKYYLPEEADYQTLKAGTQLQLPEYPKAAKDGSVPAIECLRVSLARRIIQGRRRLGLTQAQLAKASRLRPETISRLENGKHTPDERTLKAVFRVLGKTPASTRRGPNRAAGAVR